MPPYLTLISSRLSGCQVVRLSGCQHARTCRHKSLQAQTSRQVEKAGLPFRVRMLRMSLMMLSKILLSEMILFEMMLQVFES